MPEVTPGVYRRLWDNPDAESCLIPAYERGKGHPVLLPQRAISLIHRAPRKGPPYETLSVRWRCALFPWRVRGFTGTLILRSSILRSRVAAVRIRPLSVSVGEGNEKRHYRPGADAPRGDIFYPAALSRRRVFSWLY